jgi:hypothetical protein
MARCTEALVKRSPQPCDPKAGGHNMTISAINRPKILVQAARHGVTTHERKSHLQHLFGWQEPKSL